MVYEEGNSDKEKNGENIDIEKENGQEIDLENVEENEQVEDQNDEVAKLKGLLARTQADFDNFRKRSFQEKLDLHRVIAVDHVKDLLGIIDTMEKASVHITEDHLKDPVVQGIVSVAKSISGLFSKWKIFEIEIEPGKTPLNIKYHDVVSTKSGPKDVVMEVFQKGYVWKNLEEEYVVRPAQVIVGDGSIE